MSQRRVVVTGLGLISPVGNSVAEAWPRILAGQSGIATITKFDASNLACTFAGEVKGFEVAEHVPGKEAKHMDTFIHYGLAAALQAVRDAGLPTGDQLSEEQAERIGCMIGSGIGGLPEIERTVRTIVERGPRRISPFFVPASIINMISGHLSIQCGFTGPNLSIVTACTSGLHSIGQAARLIEYGDADVMVAGGAEATVSTLGVGGFASARALSTRNDDPATASRPWDKDRDGFVLGEGAGVMVLEEYEHARQRGARIYAEVIGFGMNADARDMINPSVDGARDAMLLAMRGIPIADPARMYINAHGTGTLANDPTETQAIRQAFGTAASAMAVSSTKSMHGHLLGGAGAVESIAAILALRHGFVPPTINLDEPDPACDLDYTPNRGQARDLDIAISNSFAFGGLNAVVAFGRPA